MTISLAEMREEVLMDNIEAIFLDMDGTLLHKDNKVDLETTKVIQQVRGHGYKVFLATGRAHDEIRNLIPSTFEVDGIISSNGTLGKVNDETIFKHSLDFNTVDKIVARAQEQNIYYEVFPFDQNRIILEKDKEWTTELFENDTPPGDVSESEWASRRESISEKVDWVSRIPDTHFSKIYLFSPEYSKIARFRETLANEQEDLRISISNSSRFNAETMAYKKDKGTGIKEMIDHFNIPQASTLVMGDSDNDRSMFAFGGYTIAMKNARPEIQALTDDVTTFTNEENGVAKYLSEHFL